MSVKRELYFSDPRCLEVWEVSQSPEMVTCYRRLGAVIYTPSDRVPVPSQIGFGSVSVHEIFAGIV